jgi:SAM-dependent methyltransferase
MTDIYSKRIWDKNLLPATYSNKIFADAITLAARISEQKPNSTLWDLMSATGLVFELISEKRQDLTICSIDRSEALLEKAQNKLGKDSSIKILTFKRDVRDGFEGILPLPDVIVSRYALKDVGKEYLSKVISDCAQKLNQGGRLVIADMSAPNVAEAEMITKIHSKKQQLAGRDIKPREQAGDDDCYIPSTDEWISLLQGKGFNRVKISWEGFSIVETQQWVDSHQIEPEQLVEMNTFILNQIPKELWEQYGIKVIKEDTLHKPLNVEIKFPIFVAYGEK